MSRTVIRNGYLYIGSGKRKRRRGGIRRQKGGFGALGAIGAQIGVQLPSNLINKIF